MNHRILPSGKEIKANLAYKDVNRVLGVYFGIGTIVPIFFLPKVK
jgi:hypothetical protein